MIRSGASPTHEHSLSKIHNLVWVPVRDFRKIPDTLPCRIGTIQGPPIGSEELPDSLFSYCGIPDQIVEEIGTEDKGPKQW